MLNWWLGKSGEDKHRDNDNLEPPETPAPLFAIRAVKSALLGTPAPPPDDTIAQEQEEREAMEEALALESPTKRQGILMTPGTARTRKTVTFGSQVTDNNLKPNSKSGIPDDCPGKFPSPWVPKEPSPLGEGSAKKTALTRSMERVRDTRKKQEETQVAKSTRAPIDTPKPLRLLEVENGLTEPQLDEAIKNAVERSKAREAARQAEEDALMKARAEVMDVDENDFTIDFSEPRSQSGRFWKTEYESYHKDATEQMKKLIRYKRLAKNYAKKKDEEASNLAAKLEEEQRRVFEMEDRVAELVSRLARNKSGSNDDSAELLDLLAKQTALALQYRSQVDKFREALEGKEKAETKNRNTSRPATTTDSLEEMEQLRQKMEGLQTSLNTAERRAAKLQDENATLFRELAKTKADLNQSEKRRQAAESDASASNKRFDELQDTYNTLKDNAKKQRRDAEQLLKKRHDEASGLKKEIMNLKGQLDGRKLRTSSEDEAAVERRNKRRARRASMSNEDDNMVANKPTTQSRYSLKDIRTATEIPKSERTIYDDNETKIPQFEGSTLKPRRSSGRISEPSVDSRKPRPRSTAALGEITNKIINEPAQPLYEEDLHANLRQRFSALSNGGRTASKPDVQARPISMRVQPSPRPSMYSFSPEKREGAGTASRNIRNDGYSSREDRPNRLDSMASTRSRTNLDPERAAAAKARLEKRNAEKRRLRESSGWQKSAMA